MPLSIWACARLLALMVSGCLVQMIRAKGSFSNKGDTRINPADLEGEHKRKRQAKEERLASIMSGREVRSLNVP
eukprot:1134599-Prorocentrum_minimum.AAC.2